MKLKDLIEFVKLNNVNTDVELGFIDDDGYYGSAEKFTILVNGYGEEMLCFDANE